MRCVIVESPFSADTDDGIEFNRNFLAECLRDSLLRGEAPFASHAIYTLPGVLSDSVPSEREIGIEAGLAIGLLMDATVVYNDFGISKGMRIWIDRAVSAGRLVEYRTLKTECNNGGEE